MSEILKLIGVAFVTSVTAMLLKGTKPELSFAVTATGIIVMLLFLLDGLQDTISVFTRIARLTGVKNGLLRVLLKIVGVGYITEFGAGVLSDFGSNALADKVTLGGKITIVVLSLPIFEGVLTVLGELLELL